MVSGNGNQLLNLLFCEKPLSVIRFASRLDGALGVGSGLTYAGHNCITIVCDWARIPQGSKYEMKQAPISVNRESLADALEKADCASPSHTICSSSVSCPLNLTKTDHLPSLSWPVPKQRINNRQAWNKLLQTLAVTRQLRAKKPERYLGLTKRIR